MNSDLDITAAARIFSKLGAAKGGMARAKALTADERRSIATKAANAKWAKRNETKGDSQENVLPKETHQGILKIGDREIPCSVLDNGMRVLSSSGISRVMGSRKKGRDIRIEDRDNGSPQLPPFLYAANVKSFIPNELMAPLSSPKLYKPKHGGSAASGYEATLVPQICGVILDAEKAGALRPNQQYLVDTADLLIRAFARVGIIALVDEATGYQAERDRDALHKILEAYISKELLPWTRKFPPEFYKQLFRLQGWQYSPLSVRRPINIAQLTIRIVYDKLPPGVYEALTKKNPIIKDGRRKNKLFQHMTEEIGQKHLEMHLASVTTLMRISPDKNTFDKILEKAFPTLDRPVQEEMEYGDGFTNDVIDIEAMIAPKE